MKKKDISQSPIQKLNRNLDDLAFAVLDQMRALEIAMAGKKIQSLRDIVAKDKDIDTLELTLDRAAKAFMEMRAPVGPDFRFVLASLEISRNLERIGDCVEYVARHVVEILETGTEWNEAYLIMIKMLEKSRDILHQAYQAWQAGDSEKARKIPDEDDFVDALQDQAYKLVIENVRSRTVDIELGLLVTLITNKIESIADIACHVAESVVFVVLAKQIRHDQETHNG